MEDIPKMEDLTPAKLYNRIITLEKQINAIHSVLENHSIVIKELKEKGDK